MDWIASTDYYAELELEQSANFADIKNSYHRLARIHHPDKNPDAVDVATARFQRIQEAFEVLSDARRRDKYDASRARQAQGQNMADNDWEPYESDNDEQSDQQHDAGSGGSTFKYHSIPGFGYVRVRQFQSYEAMEQQFMEQRRHVTEQAARYAARMAQIHKERREREKQAKERYERERADRAAAEAEARAKVQELASAERKDQEQRWVQKSAVSFDEKRVACLHSAHIWYKETQTDGTKFKCQNCSAKRIMSFSCPYCQLNVCQICRNQLADRRQRLKGDLAGEQTTPGPPQAAVSTAKDGLTPEIKTECATNDLQGGDKEDDGRRTTKEESNKRHTKEGGSEFNLTYDPPVHHHHGSDQHSNPDEYHSSVDGWVRRVLSDAESGMSNGGGASVVASDGEDIMPHDSCSHAGGTSPVIWSQAPIDHDLRPCVFFARGYCRDGGNCRFSHDNNQNDDQWIPAHESVPSVRACTFFARGHCKKGSKCDFSHAIGQKDAHVQSSKQPTPVEHTLLTRQENAVAGTWPESPKPLFNSPTSSYQRLLDRAETACAFFANGRCKKGAQCDFSHKLANGNAIPANDTVLRAPTSDLKSTLPKQSQTRSQLIARGTARKSQEQKRGPPRCKYFMRGHCKDGHHCKFSHETAKHDLVPNDKKHTVVASKTGSQPAGAGQPGPRPTNADPAQKSQKKNPIPMFCMRFTHGRCKNGNRCKFSHDPNAIDGVSSKDQQNLARGTIADTDKNLPIPDNRAPVQTASEHAIDDKKLSQPTSQRKACVFFAKGTCTRGIKCPFHHNSSVANKDNGLISDSQGKRQQTCGVCGKKGHLTVNCWYKDDGRRGGRHGAAK